MSISDLDDDISDIEFLPPIKRLDRDLRAGSRILGAQEARFLVDAYYIMQEQRKRTANQKLSIEGAGEPADVISWLMAQSKALEDQIKVVLDLYTSGHLMGSWMRQIYGIGPVLSAGLLAHIHMGIWCDVCAGRTLQDCERRQGDKKFNVEPHEWTPTKSLPTAGHIWSFAGIASDRKNLQWTKGQRRPHNAILMSLCWKIGQSFMKFSNQPRCYYGRIYRERKEWEMGRNERGLYAEKAADALPHFSKTTESYKSYVQGKLPPGHIDARARRYAVKMFLSHMHAEWYRRVFNEEPPKPYAVAILGHAHIVPPPPGTVHTDAAILYPKA